MQPWLDQYWAIHIQAQMLMNSRFISKNLGNLWFRTNNTVVTNISLEAKTSEYCVFMYFL